MHPAKSCPDNTDPILEVGDADEVRGEMTVGGDGGCRARASGRLSVGGHIFECIVRYRRAR
jgi:hypothetical protein